MSLHALTLVCCLGLGANERVVDGFQYQGGEQAAACPWIPNTEAAAPKPATRKAGRCLKLPAPFADHPDLDRVYIDRSVNLDLSRAKEFVLEMDTDNLDAVGSVTLYFRSKSGWYGCYGGFRREGRQKIVFPKAKFRPEGNPAGWNKIDRIRIAAWQSKPTNANVFLYRLVVPQSTILIVRANPDTHETALSKTVAGRCARMLARERMKSDSVEEAALEEMDLSPYRVILFPHNPRLDPRFYPKLVQYVANGGKVFLNYHLHGDLGKALGFAPARWKKQEAEGDFAEVRFDPESEIPGLPEKVKQNSWNITVAKPVGHGARVLGRWFSAKGNPTGDAALLLSDRGAYFSHIWLDDDIENKSAALAAIVGKLAPELWHEVARRRLEAAAEIGHGSAEETDAFIESCGNAGALAAFEQSRKAVAAAKKTMESGEYYKADRYVETACAARRKAYLLSHPSPKVEGRGFWNHSGTGAYPGDWDRTMRELADGGFNMIYPNMCWGGCAHYASDVLPRSRTFEQWGDQIEQCVAAGKKHGVEVHVWKVNFYLSHRTPKEFIEKLRAEGRLQQTVDGEELLWLCPSHPKNFELERDAMVEVATKYDVDGVHFDYIRYKGPQYCYCDGCRKRFEAERGKKVENWPQDCYSGKLKDEYNQWKCDRITRIVKAVHDKIKRVKPEVRVSAAVFSNYPSCTRAVSQDWVHWAKSGYVDFLCPMDYTESERSYANLTARQLELVDGAVPLYPGIGVTTSHPILPPDEVAAQVFRARALGAGGFTIFNLSEREATSLLPGLKLGVGKNKAVPPSTVDSGGK